MTCDMTSIAFYNIQQEGKFTNILMQINCSKNNNNSFTIVRKVSSTFEKYCRNKKMHLKIFIIEYYGKMSIDYFINTHFY